MSFNHFSSNKRDVFLNRRCKVMFHHGIKFRIMYYINAFDELYL